MAQNNILIIGSSGQLGTTLFQKKNNFVDKTFFFSKNQLDIGNYVLLEEIIKNYKINLIINCSGYTNVDKAESDRIKCNLVNNIYLKNLCYLSKKYEIFLFHFSTDYIFDGKKNKILKENDIANPQNFYGKSKLEGEKLLLNFNLNAIILRVSWLYSFNKSNFYTWVIKNLNQKILRVTNDQISSPTNINELTNNLIHIINNRIYKKIDQTTIFHYSDKGYCSKLDFTKLILKFSKKTQTILMPILTEELNLPAKRPLFTPFNVSKFENFLGIKLNSWELNLKNMIIG